MEIFLPFTSSIPSTIESARSSVGPLIFLVSVFETVFTAFTAFALTFFVVAVLVFEAAGLVFETLVFTVAFFAAGRADLVAVFYGVVVTFFEAVFFINSM